MDQCRSGNAASNTVIEQITANLGVEQATQFQQARADFCKAVGVYLQLSEMLAQYQFYQANGYTLAERAKSQKLSVKVKLSKFTRTVQAQMRVAWYPDVQTTINDGLSAQDKLTYSADWKWPDDPWRQLGSIAKTLAESTGGGERYCFPVSGSVKLCFNTSDVTPESVKIHMWVIGHFKSHDKTMDLGTETIPAPFGYLDQVAQMKEDWAQSMKSRLENQIASMLQIDPQIVNEVAQLSAIAAQSAEGSGSN